MNKVNTKVILNFNVRKSSALNDAQKKQIELRLAHRLDKEGNLKIVAQKHRSQSTNRKAALERLVLLIANALVIPRERVCTSVPRSSRVKRLERKRYRSRIKDLRKTGRIDPESS